MILRWTVCGVWLALASVVLAETPPAGEGGDEAAAARLEALARQQAEALRDRQDGPAGTGTPELPSVEPAGGALKQQAQPLHAAASLLVVTPTGDGETADGGGLFDGLPLLDPGMSLEERVLALREEAARLQALDAEEGPDLTSAQGLDGVAAAYLSVEPVKLPGQDFSFLQPEVRQAFELEIDAVPPVLPVVPQEEQVELRTNPFLKPMTVFLPQVNTPVAPGAAAAPAVQAAAPTATTPPLAPPAAETDAPRGSPRNPEPTLTMPGQQHRR